MIISEASLLSLCCVSIWDGRGQIASLHKSRKINVNRSCWISAASFVIHNFHQQTLKLVIDWARTALSTFSLKWISTNFPKRLLLLFRTVLAFPKASSRGFAAREKEVEFKLKPQQEADERSRSDLTFDYPLVNVLTRSVRGRQVSASTAHHQHLRTRDSSVILKQRFSQVYSLEGFLKQVNIKVCSIKTVFVGPYFIFNTAENAVRRRKKTISDIQQNKSGRLSDVCVKAKNDALQEVQLC